MHILQNTSDQMQQVKVLRRVVPAGGTLTLTAEEFKKLQTSGVRLPWAKFVEPLIEGATPLAQVKMPVPPARAAVAGEPAAAGTEDDAEGAKKKRTRRTAE